MGRSIQSESELIGPMVIVPSGSFMMGSNNGDPDEKPVHKVKINNFKVMPKEVTWHQYMYCVKALVCAKPYSYKVENNNLPVVNISFDDIQTYIKWLNKSTGEKYRLPSEAEWEYAARAGTTTLFSWGDYSFCSNHANCNGNGHLGTQNAFTDLSPGGSYPGNDFGLYDMHGNVWEWTQDCWSDSYENTPVDGSAYSEKNCKNRVIRGGSADSKASGVRSANRYWRYHILRDSLYGFRLVKDV